VFIVCENNKVFSDITQVPIYRHRDSAELACRRAQEKVKEEQGKLWNANKPTPKFKVHGFYLVHEDLFRD
jgi:hypothetical protein